MWPFKNKNTQANTNDDSIRYSSFKSENTRRSKRMFAAAISNRLTADFITQSTSIDAEIRSSLPKLRDRSRQLCRDNDYARSVIRTIRNNVVGQGVTLQSQVKMLRGSKGSVKLNEHMNAQIEAAWEKWSKKQNCHVAGKLSFSDIERLIIDSVMTSGEVLVRFVMVAMGNSRVPLALEIIESDLLDDSYNDVLPNGNRVRMGVEMNQWFRPVAYHFKKKHPGDYPFHDGNSAQRERILADEILHLFITERVGQTRGVPCLASSILRLHHTAGFEEAEVIAARASASLMGFIESPQGDTEGDDIDDNGDKITEFSPGVIKTLAAGEKMNVPQITRPGGAFAPFIQSQLRAVGAGAGPSYESISRDYSQSNYSSSRLALLEDRDNWRVLQSWMIENFHQIVFEKFMDLAVLSGELVVKDYEINSEAYKKPKWQARGWSWVDPVKEVNAYNIAVRSGFMTQADVIAQGGGDFEDFMVLRQREIKKAKEMELVFDTNPALVNDKGSSHSGDPETAQNADSKGEAV